MSAPEPKAVYVEAAPVSLPLDVDPYAFAGHMCPTCRKVHAGRFFLSRADAVACCWCAKHDERRTPGGECLTCVNEEFAAYGFAGAPDAAPAEPGPMNIDAEFVLDAAGVEVTPGQREALQALLDGWVASLKTPAEVEPLHDTEGRP